MGKDNKAPQSRKTVVGNEIVKTRKGHTRTNKPVLLPDNPTWLIQPNLITLMSHDYKILNIRILIAVIEKIQSAIEQSIQGIEFEQMTLFVQPTDPIRLVINFRDLGVHPRQYPEVKIALEDLSTIPVVLDAVDPVTGADSWKLQGLLKAYVPKEKNTRTFTLEIDRDVAKKFVSVDKGWTKFMKQIAFSTSSKYTVRIYMLISSWKDKGGFQMTIAKFRQWLKIENKYAEYKDLYKCVIKIAYDDLFEKSDCWFEVSESFKLGESEPYKLNFKVIKSALSAKEQELLDSNKRGIQEVGFKHLHMVDIHFKRIIPLITAGNSQKMVDKVMYLCDYVSKNYKSINDIPEYCTQVLLKEFQGTADIDFAD